MPVEGRELGEAEARDMVLSLALQLAGEVVERAEAAGLSQAMLQDEADALGATWRMTSIYYRETAAVQVTAVADLKEPAEGGAEAVEVGEHVLFFDAEQLRRLFGRGAGSEANFQFVVPVSWVKLARGAAGAPA